MNYLSSELSHQDIEMYFYASNMPIHDNTKLTKKCYFNLYSTVLMQVFIV